MFGEQIGFLCIASSNKNKANFRQKFFEWPHDKLIIANYIDSMADSQNVWFCVSLLKGTERKKEFCLPSSFLWADLDDSVLPTDIEPAPTCVVESSPGKYHTYWKIAGEAIPAEIAEDYSRRLAYNIDADKSGWDMVQLLRVPFTENLKYNPTAPVRLLSVVGGDYEVEYLDSIPNINDNGAVVPSVNGVPKVDDLPTVETILYKYKTEGKIDEEFARLYSNDPDESADWSRMLWRFINLCFRAGMSKDEVFAISLLAKCNKYARDNRPLSYLWRDIEKASTEYDQYEMLIGKGEIKLLTMPHLIDFDLIEEDSLVSEYKEWANLATDAPEQYHELTCFIALSAVICPGLYLNVQWGELVPNLWGMVLGESTLTRKTTAMRLAMDIIKDIDESLILASDGSAEGLLSGLAARPKRVSIFYKDEVSGLFDSINRKDYLAGFPETLTHLYDVPKIYPRLLRKETITITEPYFIFFGGGIRDKVYSLINEEYILSGFLPRFLIVSGENDLSRLRRTGPPTVLGTERKDNIVRKFCDLRDRYNSTITTYLAGQELQMPSRIEARLTDDAWVYFRELEGILLDAAVESDMDMVALPTFTRLSISLLKMAMLIAASRREPDASNRLTVEIDDVRQAAFYIQKWGGYAVDMLINAGKSKTEKEISRALALVTRKPGLTKAEFMQRLHLSARDAKDLIDTMSQRNLVVPKISGRGIRLYLQ